MKEKTILVDKHEHKFEKRKFIYMKKTAEKLGLKTFWACTVCDEVKIGKK